MKLTSVKEKKCESVNISWFQQSTITTCRHIMMVYLLIFSSSFKSIPKCFGLRQYHVKTLVPVRFEKLTNVDPGQ